MAGFSNCRKMPFPLEAALETKWVIQGEEAGIYRVFAVIRGAGTGGRAEPEFMSRNTHVQCPLKAPGGIEKH
jgi:hypothetical protein